MESKRELIDRLSREGKYDSFQSELKMMVKAGVPANEARIRLSTEDRYAAKVVEVDPGRLVYEPVRDVERVDDFVPSVPPMVAPLEKDKEVSSILSSIGVSSVSMHEEVRWVFANVLSETVKIDDAPSEAAYRLLLWANNEQGEFYKLFASKLMPTRDEINGKNRYHDDNRKIRAKLDAYIKAFRDEHG